jgi:hypothetical protein
MQERDFNKLAKTKTSVLTFGQIRRVKLVMEMDSYVLQRIPEKLHLVLGHGANLHTKHALESLA